MKKTIKKDKEKATTPMRILFRVLYVLALLSPLALFFVMWFLFSGIDSLLILIAGFGALILGVGLFLVVAVLDPGVPKIKFVWWIILVFLIGALITGIPSLFLFLPQLQNKQDEKQVLFYILCANLFLIMMIYIALLRSCISAYYKKNGIEKEDIPQYLKGWRNYWFYSEINRQKPLGTIRYPIIVSICLFAFALGLYLLLGWWKPMLITVGFLLSFLWVLYAILLVWGKVISYNAKKSESSETILGYIFLAAFAVCILGYKTLEQVLALL